MFCRCPKLVAGRILLLIGHLGGKAYSLRSAIITAIGHLVQKAFENVPGEDADAQGKLTPVLCQQCSDTAIGRRLCEIFMCFSAGSYAQEESKWVAESM